tara:strand:- start:2076 stop:2363 length:288 start_codon:yes stop_codon:yes gene_type:complete
MKINITSRHFTPSEHLKQIIFQKVQKILKFNPLIINCNVILTKESNREKVEIILHLKGNDFIASESSGSFEKSINIVVDKIISQVKKEHDKSIKH